MKKVVLYLQKKRLRKTWFKLNLPAYFKPVFQGKKIIAVEIKYLRNIDIEKIKEILEEKGLCVKSIS